MIVIADLHLGNVNDSVTVDGMDSQTRDVVSRLEFVLGEAKKLQKSLVIAGDVFHRLNPTSAIIAVFFGFLSECVRKNVPVYIIPGNHDSGVDTLNLPMVERAEFIGVHAVTSPEVFNIGGRSVLMWPHIPYSDRIPLEEKWGSVSDYIGKEFPDVDIIVSHGHVTGYGYTNDIFFDAGEAQIIDPTKFTGVKLIVLGHIHKYWTRGNVVYPGSVTVNNFGEVEEDKGYVVVYGNTWEWKKFDDDDVRPWKHVIIDLTEKDETGIDEEAVENAVSGATVKITVQAKNYAAVNEVFIRKLFNKYGYVSRFETVIVDRPADAVLAWRKDFSHRKILKTWLDTKETVSEGTRKEAYSLGSKIIEDVLGV